MTGDRGKGFAGRGDGWGGGRRRGAAGEPGKLRLREGGGGAACRGTRRPRNLPGRSGASAEVDARGGWWAGEGWAECHLSRSHPGESGD